MSKEVLDVGVAVFNMTPDDKERADAGFVRRFGREAFDAEVEPLHRGGIMSIFHNSPTEHSRWYAETVAFLVNERRGAKA